jgi:hypothetical protein
MRSPSTSILHSYNFSKVFPLKAATYSGVLQRSRACHNYKTPTNKGLFPVTNITRVKLQEMTNLPPYI